MPLISVIVPVYKVEQYLERCVNSILSQTFANFELILIDDGSPDNCGAICDAYEKKDKRVHVIHQENGGLSAARNAGIEWMFSNSSSEWLTFIDSDDWVHEKYLEVMLDTVLNTKTQIVVCAYKETEGENVVIKEIVNGKVHETEEFYCNYHVNATIACGKLYERKCFEKIRFPKGKIHEDEYVTHRILFMFSKLSYVEEPLYSYYVNKEGITKSGWSPKRLDSIEAIARQICYMRENGYEMAYRYVIRKYGVNLSTQILKIETCDNDTQCKYKNVLKFKLKNFLIKYHKVITFKENIWIYECAFPRIIFCYWLVKGLLEK